MNILAPDVLTLGIPIEKQSEYIVTKVLQKKGEFTRVKYARPLKFRKEYQKEHSGFKITTGTFRIGADYEHLKAVKEGRESGELPGESAGLRGVTWIVPHYIMRGKDDRILIRLYTVPNNKRKIEYELNGRAVQKEDLVDFCLASEFSHHETPLINVGIEHILEMS
jgi:hypothetical protein